MHVLVVALALALSAPRQISSPDVVERAEHALQDAMEHYNAEEYDQALRALDEAEALAPHPAIPYMRAEIEHSRGNCEVALVHYREALEQDLTPTDLATTRQRMETCEQTLTREAIVAERKRETAASSKKPQVVDTPPPPARRPWYRDPAGAALVATGTAGLAVGLGFYIQAVRDRNAADGATDLDEYDDEIRRASVFSRIGIAGISVGSALLVGGIISYVVAAKRKPKVRRDRANVRFAGPGLVGRF